MRRPRLIPAAAAGVIAVFCGIAIWVSPNFKANKRPAEGESWRIAHAEHLDPQLYRIMQHARDAVVSLEASPEDTKGEFALLANMTVRSGAAPSDIAAWHAQVRQFDAPLSLRDDGLPPRLILAAAPGGTAGSEQAFEPKLQLETGHHVDDVYYWDLDGAGATVLTGSRDSTARLWSIPQRPGETFRLLRTFRMPPHYIYDYEGKRSGEESDLIYLVSLSADGSRAAIAQQGRLCFFDTGSGTMLWCAENYLEGERKLWSAGPPFKAIAVRPDGAHVAILHNDYIVIRRAEDGAIVKAIRFGRNVRSKEYGETFLGYGAGYAFSMAYSPSGQLAVSVGGPGGIHLFSADYRLLRRIDPGPGFRNVYNEWYGLAYQLEFSPDGQKLAAVGTGQLITGGAGIPSDAAVFSARDLSVLYRPQIADLGPIDRDDAQYFHAPAWSRDGASLYLVGRVYRGHGTRIFGAIIREFADEGRRFNDIVAPGLGAWLSDIAETGAGRLYATTEGPQLTLIDKRGALVAALPATVRDVHRSFEEKARGGRNLELSHNGEIVKSYVGDLDEEGNPINRWFAFDMSEGRIYDGVAPKAPLSPAKQKSRRHVVEYARDSQGNVYGDELRIDGQRVGMLDHKLIYALSGDDNYIAISTNIVVNYCPIGAHEYKPWLDFDGNVREHYRRKGYERAIGLYGMSCSGVGWTTFLDKPISRIAVSPDGRFVIVETYDGAIRWLETKKGTEVFRLFVIEEQGALKWVAWTPEGYYDTAPGAEKYIGWRVDRGEDQPPLFYSVGQFREQFYRPDVLRLAAARGRVDTAVAEANQAAGRPDRAPDIVSALPPVVRLFTKDGATFNATSANVEFRVESPSGAPIQLVRFYVDGRQWKVRDGVAPNGRLSETLTGLPRRDVTVGVVAESSDGASEQASIVLRYAGTPEPPPEEEGDPALRPKLYVLAIGVSKYSVEGVQNLRFAHQDAIDFAESIKAQKGRLYRDVETRLLINENATSISILDGLDWLEKQTTSRDTAILFMAGHGLSDNLRRYYFLPSNGDPDRLRATAIDYVAMRETVRAISGRAIMFIDSCHSGGAFGERFRATRVGDITPLINELASDNVGAVVFSSSTGEQLSLEMDELSNGAFTEAVMSGLSGSADFTKDRVITIKELDLWIVEEVKRLTVGRQHPVTEFPKETPDSPLARLH